MTEPNPEAIVATATDKMVATMEHLFGPASTEAVFSTPERIGDDLVVTAASWERVGGFGFGGGGGQEPDSGGGVGVGAGGGGASQGRPVAVIRIGPGGIDVQPVVDLTKIGVTLLLSAVAVWRVLRS